MDRDPAYLAECRALARTVERFRTLTALHAHPEWPAWSQRLHDVLSRVRSMTPSGSVAPVEQPDRVKAAHWNIEHGNHYPYVERALRENEELSDADLVFLNEVDLGMARSGNRDVGGDLARALGRHGIWAPLFLETTQGRYDDPRMASGQGNEEGLFGLGLLSRWPI